MNIFGIIIGAIVGAVIGYYIADYQVRKENLKRRVEHYNKKE